MKKVVIGITSLVVVIFIFSFILSPAYYRNFSAFKCADGWEVTYYLPRDTEIDFSPYVMTSNALSEEYRKFLDGAISEEAFNEVIENFIKDNNLKSISAIDLIELNGNYIMGPDIPPEIKEDTFAYSAKDCYGVTDYYVKEGKELKSTSIWRFNILIERTNKKCGDCLTTFVTGCC